MNLDENFGTIVFMGFDENQIQSSIKVADVATCRKEGYQFEVTITEINGTDLIGTSMAGDFIEFKLLNIFGITKRK